MVKSYRLNNYIGLFPAVRVFFGTGLHNDWDAEYNTVSDVMQVALYQESGDLGNNNGRWHVNCNALKDHLIELLDSEYSVIH